MKDLVFPLSGPLCISEDAGLFQVVMSTFYQHEQMVCKAFTESNNYICCIFSCTHGQLGYTFSLQVLREGRPNDGGAFRELNKHSEKMFARDLPFYLIIAFRVHK